jgi:hypothetical protein
VISVAFATHPSMPPGSDRQALVNSRGVPVLFVVALSIPSLIFDAETLSPRIGTSTLDRHPACAARALRSALGASPLLSARRWPARATKPSTRATRRAASERGVDDPGRRLLEPAATGGLRRRRPLTRAPVSILRVAAHQGLVHFTRAAKRVAMPRAGRRSKSRLVIRYGVGLPHSAAMSLYCLFTSSTCALRRA